MDWKMLASLFNHSLAVVLVAYWCGVKDSVELSASVHFP